MSMSTSRLDHIDTALLILDLVKKRVVVMYSVNLKK